MSLLFLCILHVFFPSFMCLIGKSVKLVLILNIHLILKHLWHQKNRKKNMKWINIFVNKKLNKTSDYKESYTWLIVFLLNIVILGLHLYYSFGRLKIYIRHFGQKKCVIIWSHACFSSIVFVCVCVRHRPSEPEQFHSTKASGLPEQHNHHYSLHHLRHQFVHQYFCHEEHWILPVAYDAHSLIYTCTCVNYCTFRVAPP